MKCNILVSVLVLHPVIFTLFVSESSIYSECLSSHYSNSVHGLEEREEGKGKAGSSGPSIKVGRSDSA